MRAVSQHFSLLLSDTGLCFLTALMFIMAIRLLCSIKLGAEVFTNQCANHYGVFLLTQWPGMFQMLEPTWISVPEWEKHETEALENFQPSKGTQHKWRINSCCFKPVRFKKIFFTCLLIFERAWVEGRQRERDTQNPKQASGSELWAQNPMQGLDSQTSRSWPELKSDCHLTNRATQASQATKILKVVFYSTDRKSVV